MSRRRLFFLCASLLTFSYVAFYSIKLSHPALVNYDYGILSFGDLNYLLENTEDAQRFSDKPSVQLYWQCFHKRNMDISCSTSENEEEFVSFSISIRENNKLNSYSLNRGVSSDTCEYFISEIQKATHNNEYLCIDATLDSIELENELEYAWSFYALKTASGFFRYKGTGNF